MAKSMSVIRYEKPKTRRPVVHAKTKTSKLKSSKYYQKKYRGQGR